MQFEFLPNEILIDIFQYFDARDLFKAFYNLNSRFNILLQSIDNLHLTLSTSNPDDEIHIFSSYIHTLILYPRVVIDLNDFVNLHRLKLVVPTHEKLEQIKRGHFPHLQYLSIGQQTNSFSLHLPNLHEKIFSNAFPNLKSCDLFEPRLMQEIPSPNQSLSLRILKLEAIRPSAYQTILSICPNLYFIQFIAVDSPVNQCQFKPHENLKQMVIKYVNFLDELDDEDIGFYLSFVPNLEYLIFHRTNPNADIERYLNYQWLSILIKNYLPILRRFKCYFHIFQAKNLEEHLLNLLKTKFQQIHDNRYQSRLIYHLHPLSFWKI